MHLSSSGAGVLTAPRRKTTGGWGGMTRAHVDEAKRKREDMAASALVLYMVKDLLLLPCNSELKKRVDDE